MQHGLFDSSDAWIVGGKDISPALILADNGFDVWLANSRGNKYSIPIQFNDGSNSETQNDQITNQNYQLNKKSEFVIKNKSNFDKHADFDIPDTIEFILNYTQQEKLAYIGHSSGNAQMFYGLWKNESYFSEKINLFLALGASTDYKNAKSKILQNLSQNHKWVYKVITLVEGERQIFNTPISLTSKLQTLGRLMFPSLFNKFVELATDTNSSDINDQVALLRYQAHYPSGSSAKQLDHFSQMISQQKFQLFDYGLEQNLQIYNQTSPPEIMLENIKEVPIGLFCGENDQISTVEDNRIIRDRLQQNGKLVHYKEYKNIGHSSFMVAKDPQYMKDVIELLQKYNK
eukprot:403343911